MLIETLIICALTTVPPYYDCSENWTIYIYDSTTHSFEDCSKLGYEFNACTIWDTSINKYEVRIALDQPEWYDACGNITLWHELNHLKYLDGSYCHKHLIRTVD